MATAVATTGTLSAEKIYVDGRMLKVFGPLTIGAAPATYATGGIVFALNDPLIKAQRAPVKVRVDGRSGYIYEYVPGSNNTNGLLKIFVQDAVATNPLAEMANALAIPAGVSGDTIDFEATFLGQN